MLSYEAGCKMRIAAAWLSSAGQLPVPAALEYRISGIANTPLLFSDNFGIISDAAFLLYSHNYELSIWSIGKLVCLLHINFVRFKL